MKLLRLPVFSHRPSFVGLDGDTLSPPKDDVGSHKFPENPVVPLPCSRTPAEPWCLAFTAPRCCPPTRERRGPQRPRVISELYHTASALAVYASCRHHWRRRKTRFRGWPTFPGWDSSLPTEFCREVSAFRRPLPLGFAWRCPYTHLSLTLESLNLETGCREIKFQAAIFSAT